MRGSSPPMTVGCNPQAHTVLTQRTRFLSSPDLTRGSGLDARVVARA